ncbi:MAG: PilZ domain-containing protein, partial [Myxococcaceae bacterium]|nr:PilZ domain-containing protein [Myxococcaceae bacterium]
MKPVQEALPEPQSFERRSDVRIPIHVEVRFEEVAQAARALKAFTTNVSAGGLCLLTQHAYPVGHRLSVTLSVQSQTLQLQA